MPISGGAGAALTLEPHEAYRPAWSAASAGYTAVRTAAVALARSTAERTRSTQSDADGSTTQTRNPYCSPSIATPAESSM